jgi:hypothetical protein
MTRSEAVHGASTRVGQALGTVGGFHDVGSAIFSWVAGFGENVVPLRRFWIFTSFLGTRLVH